MEDSLIRIAYIEYTRQTMTHTASGTVSHKMLPEKKWGLINPAFIVHACVGKPVEIGSKTYPTVRLVVANGQAFSDSVMLEEDFCDAFGYDKDTICVDRNFHGMVSEVVGEAEV